MSNDAYWQMKEFAKKVSEIKTVMPKQAYEFGYDAGRNGANETNCHFSIFSTKENTAEWERGKADALKPRKRKPRKVTKR